MIDLTRKKLGKQFPKYDARTLRLARYLTPALPPPPPARQWSTAVTMPCGELLNDQIGDCTIAAVGHAVQVLTANVGAEVTIPDSDIEATYEAVGGYQPGNPATDNGCALLDVLNWWRTHGIGGHTILAFVQVNPQNLFHVKTAIEYFGGLYIGLGLPQSAQSQIGGVWDVPPGGVTGPGALYSWGGHGVFMPDYDEDGFYCLTWAERQRMTLAFQQAYMDEGYCVVTTDFINRSTQATPDGLNLALLQTDLAAVSG
jgi:hypothetical protein